MNSIVKTYDDHQQQINALQEEGKSPRVNKELNNYRERQKL